MRAKQILRKNDIHELVKDEKEFVRTSIPNQLQCRLKRCNAVANEADETMTCDWTLTRALSRVVLHNGISHYDNSVCASLHCPTAHIEYCLFSANAFDNS